MESAVYAKETSSHSFRGVSIKEKCKSICHGDQVISHVDDSSFNIILIDAIGGQ